MKVFVYGTLKVPGLNLDDAIYCSDVYAITSGDKPMFPAVVGIGHGERLFYGQVLDVAEDVIPQLDRFEGAPLLYKRVATETLLGDKVWVYEYNIDVQGLEYLIPYQGNHW